MRLSSEAEAVGAAGVGVLSTLIGNATGLIEMGTDVATAFILGAAGAAGGYVVKELFNAIINRIRKSKGSRS